MKGFKDKEGKFHPTENKVGTRMKRSKTLSATGVKIKSVTLKPESIKKVNRQIVKDLNDDRSTNFSSALNKVIEKARLARINTLAKNEMKLEHISDDGANSILLKTDMAVRKIFPSAKRDTVMTTASPFQDRTSFLHSWENSKGDIVFQMKFLINRKDDVDVIASGDYKVIDEVLM